MSDNQLQENLPNYRGCSITHRLISVKRAIRIAILIIATSIT